MIKEIRLIIILWLESQKWTKSTVTRRKPKQMYDSPTKRKNHRPSLSIPGSQKWMICYSFRTLQTNKQGDMIWKFTLSHTTIQYLEQYTTRISYKSIIVLQQGPTFWYSKQSLFPQTRTRWNLWISSIHLFVSVLLVH